MKRTRSTNITRGFALPTVMIASVVMLMVLLSGLVATTSTSTTLRTQYNNTVAVEAAEAGINLMTACLNGGLIPQLNVVYKTNATSCTDPTANASKSANVIKYDGTAGLAKVNTRYDVKVSLADNVYTIYSIGYIDYLNSAGTVVRTENSGGLYGRVSVGSYDIQSGNDTSCAINVGKLFCWGKNTSGQVGNGATTSQLLPVRIQGQLGDNLVTAVATGYEHTCAIARDPTQAVTANRLYCWGDNTQGAYGDVSTAKYSTTPILALDNTGTVTNRYVSAVSARDHTCVIAPMVTLPASYPTAEYCWGNNSNTQAGEESGGGAPVIANPKLGHGSAIRTGDTISTTLSDVRVISNVSNNFSCNINGTQVYCWGLTNTGQIGANSSTGNSNGRAIASNGSTGTTADDMNNATLLYSNYGRTCAINSGKLYCWGSNGDPAKGWPDYRIDSGLTNIEYAVPTPVAVSPGPATAPYSISSIVMGDSDTCVLISYKVYCWGYNDKGQLGQGNTLGADNTPSYSSNSATAPPASNVLPASRMKQVQGALANEIVLKIAAGNSHFCAQTASRKTFCWGSNAWGQIGDGTTNNALSPVEVPLPKSLKAF